MGMSSTQEWHPSLGYMEGPWSGITMGFLGLSSYIIPFLPVVYLALGPRLLEDGFLLHPVSYLSPSGTSG